MCNSLVNRIQKESRTRGTRRAMMLYLAQRCHPETGFCFPSVRRMASDMGLSERTITRNLPVLAAMGELHIQHAARTVEGLGGLQRVNVYRITLPKEVDDPSPPTSNIKPALRSGCRVPPKIADYSDIFNPEYEPVAVAMAVTGDRSLLAMNSFAKQLRRVGEKSFRDKVAELFGEMQVDTIEKPGAILTNKLKAIAPQHVINSVGAMPTPACVEGVGIAT